MALYIIMPPHHIVLRRQQRAEEEQLHGDSTQDGWQPERVAMEQRLQRAAQLKALAQQQCATVCFSRACACIVSAILAVCAQLCR